MRRYRRRHSLTFKAKVALAALKGVGAPAGLTERFDEHPNRITRWERHLLSWIEEVFPSDRAPKQDATSLKELQAKIDQLGLGIAFFWRRARQIGRIKRKAVSDRTQRLPISRQGELLSLSCRCSYYHPVPTSELNLHTMRRMDEFLLELPLAGARVLRDLLGLDGWKIDRKYVRTFMECMGFGAIYRSRITSWSHAKHAVFSYLLRSRTGDRPHPVWAADVPYISMSRGFVSLVAVTDWFTRKVLFWKLSNALTADFCVDALRDARACFSPPEIFNAD